MDITQSLKDAENSLRDFILSMLVKEYGESWLAKTGVSEERVKVWKERKQVEEVRQRGGVVEERLIYYADFYDLGTILNKNWDLFSDALGDKKTFNVYFKQLEALRNPDAHRRELLPHQKNLVLGISGEIRARIVRYRSSSAGLDEYFPRIECVRTSLGDIWTPPSTHALNVLDTKKVLHPGDIVDFVITASDPEDRPLQYRIDVDMSFGEWGDKNEISLRLEKKHITKALYVEVKIKSDRDYHASGGHDDKVTIFYSVLPIR